MYAYDAADPLLPLIGGGTGADSFHDFIFLFEPLRPARPTRALGAER